MKAALAAACPKVARDCGRIISSHTSSPLSHVFHDPLVPLATMPSQHQPTTESRPTLIDFIYTVPSPVTIELVALSPYISSIRRVLEITSWKSHWTESWLVLGAWWGICLLAYPGLR